MERSRVRPGLPPRDAAALPHIRAASSMPSGVPSANHATFKAPLQVPSRRHRKKFETSEFRAHRRFPPDLTGRRSSGAQRPGTQERSPDPAASTVSGGDAARFPRAGSRASTPRKSATLSARSVLVVRLADGVITEIPASRSRGGDKQRPTVHHIINGGETDADARMVISSCDLQGNRRRARSGDGTATTNDVNSVSSFVAGAEPAHMRRSRGFRNSWIRNFTGLKMFRPGRAHSTRPVSRCACRARGGDGLDAE